jgi:retinol dehydrogenase 12
MDNPQTNHHPLSGKVYVVTGATAGIGRVTAEALAAQGAQVVMCGRNPLKARQAVQEIQAKTGNPAVSCLLADFSNLHQVRALATAIREGVPRLDVLVNNAGAFFNWRRPTSYGVEMTFLVNHLAPFLLTNLLLDLLKTSTPARIINVASEGHRQDSMNFEDLGFRRFYFGMMAYARSKLANILFTYELARRLDTSGVTANALHPGHVATDIWRTDFSIFGPLLKGFMRRIALTPEQGADNSIYLATSPEVAKMTGKYFVKRQAAVSSPASYDTEIARRLWEISEQIVTEKN